jgi:hypothetical protein
MAVIDIAGSQDIETVQGSPHAPRSRWLAGDGDTIHGPSRRVVSKKKHEAGFSSALFDQFKGARNVTPGNAAVTPSRTQMPLRETFRQSCRYAWHGNRRRMT